MKTEYNFSLITYYTYDIDTNNIELCTRVFTFLILHILQMNETFDYFINN